MDRRLALLALTVLLVGLALNITNSEVSRRTEANLAYVDRILGYLNSENECVMPTFEEADELQKVFAELQTDLGQDLDSKLSADAKLARSTLLEDWDKFRSNFDSPVVLLSAKRRSFLCKVKAYQEKKFGGSVCADFKNVKGPVTNRIFQRNPIVRYLQHLDTGEVVDPPAVAELDIKREVVVKAVAEAKAKTEQDGKEEAERKERAEAEELARAAKERAKADESLRVEAEAWAEREELSRAETQARAEAKELARAGADEEARARLEAEELARTEEEEARARAAAETREKAELEEKARVSAEAEAVSGAQEQARNQAQTELEAEREKARQKAVEKLQAEVEARTKEEREERARAEAEELARAKAEELAMAQAQVVLDAEREKVRRETEEKLKAETEARARAELEEGTRAEAEERASARTQAGAEAPARTEQGEKERAKAGELAEAQAELDAEIERARREAEERLRIGAEARAKAELEERARVEAEERTIAQAQADLEESEKARLEAEERLQAEAAARAAEEKGKVEEARQRAEAEERARAELERSINASDLARADEETQMDDVRHRYIGHFTIKLDRVPKRVTITVENGEEEEDDIERDPLVEIPVPSQDDSAVERRPSSKFDQPLDANGPKYFDADVDDADLARLARAPDLEWHYDTIYGYFTWPDECNRAGNYADGHSACAKVKLDDDLMSADGTWAKFLEDPDAYDRERQKADSFAGMTPAQLRREKEKFKQGLIDSNRRARIFGHDNSHVPPPILWPTGVPRDRWRRMADNNYCKIAFNTGRMASSAKSGYLRVKTYTKVTLVNSRRVLLNKK